MARPRKRWPKVHVVCSGGGTKGAAQSGALEAITDLIGYADAYSGASVGAINAAWYALEKDPKELEKLWKNLSWYDILSIPGHDVIALVLGLAGVGIGIVFTMPIISVASLLTLIAKFFVKQGLFSDRAIKKLLKKHFGDATLGDVKHRLIIKTTDVNGAESIAYDSKRKNQKHVKIVDAILHSIRFPVVYEPIVQPKEHKVYADGGILDNVPCDIGKEYNSNIVLWLGYRGKIKKWKPTWWGMVFKTIDAMMSEDARESMARIKTKGLVMVKFPFLYDRGTFQFDNLDYLYKEGYNTIVRQYKDKIIEAKHKYVI